MMEIVTSYRTRMIMSNAEITVATSQLRNFLCELLQAYSVYEVDAEVTVQRLFDAYCLGHVQLGFDRVPGIMSSLDLGDIDPRGMRCIQHETAAITFSNGNQALAEVDCSKAVEELIQKAKQVGISLSVIKNSQNLGAPCVYSHLLAEKNCIGYCITSSGHSPHIFLPNSDQPILKSHPSSWSFPGKTAGEAVSVEFSTTNEHDKQIDEQIFSLTGIGGLMLSIVKGMLTSVLAGRNFPVAKTRGSLIEQAEHYMFAIDPEHFGGLNKMQDELALVFQKVAGTPLTKSLIKKNSLPANISLKSSLCDKIVPFAERRKVKFPV